MTAQIGDNFSIDGVTAHLMCCPALPWHHPRLIKMSREEAMNTCRNTIVFSTACWREYVATWRLEGDRLYLDAIEGIYKLDGDEPFFADWITEVMRISRGEMLSYVHMGFGSVYEQERLLNVRMGFVVGRSVRDNRGIEHDSARLSWEHLPTDDTVTPGWKPGRN